MKLKNKISGEIKEFALFDGNELQGGATLESLTKEWEDAPEEPKEYWTISGAGYLWTTEHMSPDTINDLRRIGNLFESKEKAELAVRKLKAAKRLRDKGFRFTGVEDVERVIRFEIPFRAGYDSCEAEADLDICFGGKK